MTRKKRKRSKQGFRSRPAKSEVTLSRRTFWLVSGAVVLFMGLFIAFAAWSARPEASTVSAALIQGKAKGSPEAPVTMLIFSDFRCGHCTRFALTTARELEEEYVKTGKLRMEFKHFVVGGSVSTVAAAATECAAEQGRFWDYHDMLYEREGSPLDVPHLKQYAGELGLDQAAFEACMDSGKYLEKVRQDTQEGQSWGINGTPSFVIGGQTLVGNVPLADFREVIEAALPADLRRQD